MLLAFSVYSAQNLDVAEETAKKVIRDLLKERSDGPYIAEALRLVG